MSVLWSQFIVLISCLRNHELLVLQIPVSYVLDFECFYMFRSFSILSPCSRVLQSRSVKHISKRSFHYRKGFVLFQNFYFCMTSLPLSNRLCASEIHFSLFRLTKLLMVLALTVLQNYERLFWVLSTIRPTRCCVWHQLEHLDKLLVLGTGGWSTRQIHTRNGWNFHGQFCRGAAS